jgi:predicted acyltransferase
MGVYITVIAKPSEDREGRIESVDVLRGFTIAGMIVVDDPGTWSAVYPPLLHAEWNGWTYTDTIFPFFLFLAGVSLVLSFSRRSHAGLSRDALLRRLAGRAATLVLLGLALNLVSYLALGLDRFRLPGVLQRIGVCVFAAGAVWLLGGARAASLSAAVAALLLLAYAVLMRGGLEPTDNLAAHVDRAVFGVHTWKPGFDPEGILSTIPAIATTLLGALAGARLLPGSVSRGRRIRDLAAAGAVAAAAGLLWGRSFPVNKNLWTSSYALLTAGLASLALAACMALEPWSLWRRATAPLSWLGRNAIAAFSLSTLGAIGLLAVKVAGPDGKPRSLWRTIHLAVFDRFADPRLGSLLFALAYLAVWIAVCGVLYRKRIYLKI